MRKTKIVCTLGPATDKDDVLEELIVKGMNVARCNFSHGSYEEHKARIDRVKELREKHHMQTAIMLDTKGPEGQKFTLYTEEREGDSDGISITYPDLCKDVSVGSTILIDDGLLEMEVVELKEGEIVCQTKNGGKISDRKGVNVPDVILSMPFLSEKDKEDMLFGIKNDVDFIAASFVRRADDILKMRKFLNDHGGYDIHIIAKIENREGVQNIDEILEAAEGVMVARGDMGVEIPYEEVPVIQKLMIKKGIEAGKQIITATQMLDSMMKNPRPTRAETTDVANAIYDGTGAIMLSGETAAGMYPVEAVRMMSQIVEDSEQYLDYLSYQRRRVRGEHAGNISNAVCYSSVATAQELGAKAIVAPTISGFTARMLSKWRPKTPVVGLSPSMASVRQMQLYWGVKPFHAKRAESTDVLIYSSMELLKSRGIIKEQDLVVATAGVVTHSNRHEPATDTNIMRVVVTD